MTRTNRSMKGFTVIELLLAMSGIAFVLLFVVFAIMHTTNLYTKGIAIRQISQAGRQITDDISRAIRYGSDPIILPTQNRVCAGGKSYIWNTPGTVWQNKLAPPLNTAVGFVVVDGVYCTPPPGGNDVPASAREMIGNVVAVQAITVKKNVTTSRIYDISVILATSGNNGPQVDPATGNIIGCDPVFGQYCAFGDFTTQVYARGEQ